VSIVNRRNAVLGWSVWQVSKGVAKRKAKSSAKSDKGPPTKSMIAASVAGAVGAVAFWRKRRGGESSGE
jgi:hypothetical protein